MGACPFRAGGEAAVLILFLAAFVLLLIIGVPIAACLGGAALAYVALTEGLSITILTQTTFAGMASFPLLAIPLFILAGNLMREGGLTEDLLRFARLLLGHIRGGLGQATVLASAVFAAITGSAVATAAAVGSVMIPAMREAGYEDEVSAGLVSAAACLGPIIPPSIPFIIYGVAANVSIAALFLAGILPGILLALALMIYMAVVAGKRSYPREPRASGRALAGGTVRALPALAMPVIVLGGIFAGVFTPTEAGGMAVVYSLLTGFLVYRKLRFARLPAVLLVSGLETSVVMLLLGLSEPFAWVVAVEQVAVKAAAWIADFSTSPSVFLLLVNAVLLLVGIPLETAPAIVIIAPVLAPMAARFGIDPVHFGVVVCFNLVLGLITPPVGGVLFSVCGISGLSLERLSRGVWIPFSIAVGILLLVTFFPGLSTGLRGLVG